MTAFHTPKLNAPAHHPAGGAARAMFRLDSSGAIYDDGFPDGREAFKDFDRAPTGVWSLRLLVNLSRVFRRLPNQSQEAADKLSLEGEAT